MRPGESQVTPNTRLSPRHSCGGGRSPPTQAVDAQAGPACLAVAWAGSAGCSSGSREREGCSPGSPRPRRAGPSAVICTTSTPGADAFHCRGVRCGGCEDHSPRSRPWKTPPCFSSLGQVLEHHLCPPEGARAFPVCVRRWFCLRPPCTQRRSLGRLHTVPDHQLRAPRWLTCSDV